MDLNSNVEFSKNWLTKELIKTDFEENNIPYKLCNESIGHFNLLDNKGKVLMSFWSYTGKCYIPSTDFSDNIGIRNCIRKYKKIVGSDSNVKD